MQKILVTISFILFALVTFSCQETGGQNKKGVRETSAIEMLRAITFFEEEFRSSQGRYGTLKDLAEKGLINRALTAGKPFNHYIFSDSEVTKTTYCIHATRENSDSAYHDFNVDESNVIRMAPTSKTVTIVKKGEGVPISTKLEQ